MATYAIGDVQGCFTELLALLGAIRFDGGKDRLWFVGDLVNRGPASLETLRFVRDLGDRSVCVLGNHDLHLLALAHGFVKKRADDTLDGVLEAPDRAELLEWLRKLPMAHVEDRRVLVHAGLLPQWSAEEVIALAGEVEAELRGPRYREFLAQLYGGYPDRWSANLRGVDRLRVIVNAMTRLRFCTPEGVMEFGTKGELTDAPAGYLPWFDAPGRKSAGDTLICGHWSALGLRITPNLLALDSGCVWGGRLTAVCLEDRRVFQVPCAGEGAALEERVRPARRR
jgi:bis(5'-nucleosyl)-tetraphosphatase (symmetrical)